MNSGVQVLKLMLEIRKHTKSLKTVADKTRDGSIGVRWCPEEQIVSTLHHILSLTKSLPLLYFNIPNPSFPPSLPFTVSISIHLIVSYFFLPLSIHPFLSQYILSLTPSLPPPLW